MSVDLVVPYVDSSDPAWQELFNANSPHVNQEGVDAPNRFRGQGDFFRFFFRGIEKNMPWIGKVHVLVQSESQVPAWIDRSVVHVVLHEEFMPKEFLPTFNSTAIEMFLWNIPGLSEQFVYANDDVFATSAISKYKMFDGDKAITNVYSVTRMDTVYHRQVDASYREIYGCLGDKVVTVGHTMRPYYRSEMAACFKEHEESILKSMSMFREPKNFNVYLYTYDLMKKGRLIASDAVSCITSDKPKSIVSSLEHSPKMNTCVQDTDTDGDANIYEDQGMVSAFRKMFGRRSRFEDPDVPGGITQEMLDKADSIASKMPENIREGVRKALLKSWSM